MATEAMIETIHASEGRTLDPQWEEKGRRTIDELARTVPEWYESSRRIGELLHEVEVHEYYRLQEFGTFKEFLDHHGWDRREIRKLRSAYRALCEGRPSATADLATVDAHGSLPPSDERADTPDAMVSAPAVAVTIHERDTAEFKKQWNAEESPQQPLSPPVPLPPDDRSDYDRVFKRVVTWGDERICELVLHVAHARGQERILGPSACADLVEALDPAGGDEFLRKLIERNSFFAGPRVSDLVELLIDLVRDGELSRVVDAVRRRTHSARAYQRKDLIPEGGGS